ncbi:MAG: hypothetical protein A3B91_02140 [Candidatus Yanofskybacteria bacterium RIFCSPHIGHO2_02_FULL_41_29]|uniref:General secretion pathway GspH domain-containing protein n=1 Tax=Candidatus Yanofskybacteria bacterium RIFCSPHIGHO2_01_FULL_41_53 TaxID=1802663 RepID=A0A1F8EG42_9BACT|nr:MAG: hypothetical protein A2650_04985 [Candidatus Yanofskybacteria bacterium RIFCSPHIGHO2_01_FULL_41_53]OGN12326.1 MAG: hypothetical protein A3B91_02140 [Candidatus Yanofskybacteria bacterium RIFCSPHIGHO2_02_FULL_41_29]OGN17715.1 MAG: hypothetical protein A3F48_00555 [Candidatus Yanofskybacteria bacterium RIFCSPHIGHO2_12_FULL_41_9]OGN22021.1 MAG: hypothetical protein A2916_04325 [Candidatus Yanofskybacteria bacterium RIFCSPLOWO2_01_FULL_41_67]OGN28911.1 MAG: hypothetical protein A3H54_02085 
MIHNSSERGFTFVEILVVMAIVAFFAVIGIFMSGDMYHSTSFQSDINALATSLQRARSQAINNINEKAHGVKILGGDYIIFEGNTYSGSGEVIKGNSNFIFIGPDEVVFEQLSGDCPLCADITVSYENKIAIIPMNIKGRIDW